MVASMTSNQGVMYALSDAALTDAVKESLDPAIAAERLLPFIPSVVTRAHKALDDLSLPSATAIHQDELQILLQCLRLLRNLCAAGEASKSALLSEGVIHLLSRTIESLGQGSGEIGLNWTLPSVSAQLAANLSSADCAEELWTSMFPEALQTLAHVDAPATQEATSLMLLRLCMALERGPRTLTGPKGVPILAALLHGNKRMMERQQEGGKSQANDDVGLLCSFLAVRCGLLERMMRYLACDGEDESGAESENTLPEQPDRDVTVNSHGTSTSSTEDISSWLSHAHLRLSHILLMEELGSEFRDSPAIQNYFGNGASSTSSVKSNDASSTCKYLVELLRSLGSAEEVTRSANNSYVAYEESNPSKKDTQRISGNIQQGCMQHVNDPLDDRHQSTAALLQAELHLLRDIAGRDDGGAGLSGGICLVAELSSFGLIENVLAALKALGPIQNPRLSKSVDTEISEKQLAGGLSARAKQFCSKQPYEGYRTDLISIIANASYRRPQVQEEIAKNDGIELVLAQCQVDATSPLAREWALWAVRNLCEGSQRARDAIKDLRASAALDSDDLRKAGVKVSIDETSGRLVVEPRNEVVR